VISWSTATVTGILQWTQFDRTEQISKFGKIQPNSIRTKQWHSDQFQGSRLLNRLIPIVSGHPCDGDKDHADKSGAIASAPAPTTDNNQ
jgi:hypothetical protein